MRATALKCRRRIFSVKTAWVTMRSGERKKDGSLARRTSLRDRAAFGEKCQDDGEKSAEAAEAEAR